MDELTLLKERATQMGLTYHPNIGLESLKRKVDAHLSGTPEPDNSEPTTGGSVGQSAPAETKTQREQRLRHEQKKEQLKLVRLRITNLDPSKAELRGEIVTVGNRFVGTQRKFIPFGEAGEAGYHVPQIIYQFLKDKKFNQVKTRKGEKGKVIIEQKMVPEYALEVLPPLTKDELATLARTQAAAAGL